jgi:hypothetical protein
LLLLALLLSPSNCHRLPVPILLLGFAMPNARYAPRPFLWPNTRSVPQPLAKASPSPSFVAWIRRYSSLMFLGRNSLSS